MEKENKNFVIREVNGGMFVSEERLLTEDVREAMAWKSEGVAMYYLSEYIEEDEGQKFLVVDKTKLSK